MKELKKPGADLKAARDQLKPLLEAHPDPRATTALNQVRKIKPNLTVVRPLIAEGTAASTPPAWQRAQRLMLTERDEVGNADAVAADRTRLLQQGLQFHYQHGDRLCPVCGQGTLDDKWAAGAREALERDLRTANALNAARDALAAASSALIALVREVPRLPSCPDADLTHLEAAGLA